MFLTGVAPALCHFRSAPATQRPGLHRQIPSVTSFTRMQMADSKVKYLVWVKVLVTITPCFLRWPELGRQDEGRPRLLTDHLFKIKQFWYQKVNTCVLFIADNIWGEKNQKKNYYCQLFYFHCSISHPFSVDPRRLVFWSFVWKPPDIEREMVQE